MQNTKTKLLFSAILAPHRSMSPREQTAVVGLAALLGAIPSLIALSVGAWPIAIFVAVAVAGIALALRLSNKNGKRREQVILWSDRLTVLQFDLKGAVR